MKDCKKEYKRILKNASIKDIIVYNNPRPFSSFIIERVNPNHIGIIWGKRKKCMGKGVNWVKVAKVFFGVVPIFYWVFWAGLVDVLTDFMFNLVAQIGIFSIVFALAFSIVFYFPFVFRRYLWIGQY